MNTLEQMFDVQDPIATPFYDLDLVIQSFDKSTCLPVKKVIGYFIEPVFSCFYKCIKARYCTGSHLFYPTFECIFRLPLCHMTLKSRVSK